MSLSDELQKLQQLHQAGTLNDQEYASAKEKLLNGSAAATNYQAPNSPTAGTMINHNPEYIEQQTRQWAMFLHLSMLSGFIIPFGNLIAPIIIWQIKKTELPGIDAHGKNALNWNLSHMIYMFVSFLLCFIIIGFPLIIALFIVGIIFPIMAGIKANEGTVWKYPITIPFIS